MPISNNIVRTAELIEKQLPSLVSDNRLRHILGVMSTADELARRFDVDPDGARLAAVAHDMDRDRDPRSLLAVVDEWDVPITTLERTLPKLIHGPVSAERLRREYGIREETILEAVRHHTLGHPVFAEQTDPIGLLLYVADFCEPGRARHVGHRDRRGILDRDTLGEMVTGIIDLARVVFGGLEEPTERLYARLNGAEWNER
jgi:predicted HD superfamily hydrolase involved in NAD metabolism